MKQGKTSKPSPWARKDHEAAQPLSLEEQKTHWLQEELQDTLRFITTERHATLNHAAENYLPQFSNQMFGLQFLCVLATYFDDLEHAIETLGQSGALEDMAITALDLSPDEYDRLTFFAPCLDTMTELELAKEAASDQDSFKHAMAGQVLTICQMYKANLHIDDRGGPVSDEILDNLMAEMDMRRQSGFQMTFLHEEKQSIAHWPLVQVLVQVMQDLNNLALQAKAGQTATQYEMAALPYEDERLEAAEAYCSVVDAYTSSLSKHLAVHLQEEVYFLGLAEPIAEMIASYGAAAEDPDTPWALDEHMLMHWKIKELSTQILDKLAEDGLAQDDPVYYAILQKVAADITDTLIKAYPEQEDKKPDFMTTSEDDAALPSQWKPPENPATIGARPSPK